MQIRAFRAALVQQHWCTGMQGCSDALIQDAVIKGLEGPVMKD